MDSLQPIFLQASLDAQLCSLSKALFSCLIKIYVWAFPMAQGSF